MTLRPNSLPCDDGADVLVSLRTCPQYCEASPPNERKIVVACVDEISTDLYTFTTLDLKKVQIIADNVVETLFRRF